MTGTAKELLREVGRLRRHQTFRESAGAAAQGLGLAAAVGGLLLAADRVLSFPAPARAVLAFAVLAAAGVPLALALLRRLPAHRSAENAARASEREAQGLRDRLVPAIQILGARDDARTGYSDELVDAFAEDVLRRTRETRPESLPYNRVAQRRLLLGGAGILAAAGILGALGLEASRTGVLRFASALAEIGPRPPARFEVTPGNVSIPRGSSVTLAARVAVESKDAPAATLAPVPGSAVLETRSGPEEAWKATALAAASTLEHTIPAVEASFEYRFGAGRDRSAAFRVDALDAPSVRIEEVRYTYPEYTGLAPRSADDGSGDLAAVKGTRAELVVRASSEPREASLDREKGGALPLTPAEEGRLVASVPILEDDVYRLRVEDRIGVANADPIAYQIRSLTDEPPFIRVLEPGEDRDLDESLQVALRWSALDDYGLGPVALRYETSRDPGNLRTLELSTPKGRVPEASGTSPWSLAELDLLPGDTITYFLETRDNDAVSGPKSARTRSYVLRFPSLAEIYAEIDEGQEHSIDRMKDVAEEIRKVEEKVEKIGREILKEGESSWESRQEMQRALESQEKMAAELQRIQDQVQQNMQSLLESEFMSFEALQKMEQLQKLLDEATTQEMKEALEKLREALDPEDGGRPDQELEDFAKAQEELMKHLDRVIENLKQFRLEEKLKAAVRELEELAARQERVNDDHSELAKRDDAASDDEEKSGGEEKAGEDSESGEETKPEGSAKDEEAAGDESEGEKSKGQESKGGEQEDAAGEKQESARGEEQERSPEDGKDSEKKSAAPRERLAEEEKRLAEETKKLEEELKELSEMVEEMRDAQDQQGMEKVAEDMQSKDIPQTMGEMSEGMQEKRDEEAREKGEKALTELRETLAALSNQQQSMSMRMIAISQAAINRAVRDLLAVSTDEEDLAGILEEIPRNPVSATRAFADEQRRLLQGTERVDAMLDEVAKGTPLMESAVGKTLEQGMNSMREAASGLESGAVQLANQEGERAVDELNAVVIQLLRTVESMSSCPSGNPMSGAMQQLQQLSQDQEKLNETMRQRRDQMKGMKSGKRLQGHLQSLADEQGRIQRELEKLLGEIGEGGGLLGKLDDVSKKLDDVAGRMERGEIGDDLLKDQDWALTRLLDSQRSIRERDFGKERRSETAQELGESLPPSELPSDIEDVERDLREDLLKALDRRYPPKYEDLIKRYFRSLSREERTPDLP